MLRITITTLLFFLIITLDLYSQEYGTFIDERDGREYKWAEFGTQIWMTENLRATEFTNGDSIKNIESHNAWEKSGMMYTAAWCNYRNDSLLGEKYGRLYNWFVIYDIKGRDICPIGWYLPNQSDYEELFGYFSANSLSDYDGLTDTCSSCFNTKLIGWRDKNGYFHILNYRSGFWISDKRIQPHVARKIYLNVYRKEVSFSFGRNEDWGFPVRCIKGY